MIEAFFPNAMNARVAVREMQNAGLEPSNPIPCEPNNGRPWRVDVDPKQGSLGEQHPSAVLLNQVFGIVAKHDGITETVSHA